MRDSGLSALRLHPQNYASRDSTLTTDSITKLVHFVKAKRACNSRGITKSTEMEWTNKLIYEFLNLYQNEPTIWNATSPEHKNHIDAYDAWSRIKNKLKNGSIPIKELKRKRDNLMATYRKQRTKVIYSMGAGDVYSPEWPFYRIMSSFLDNVYTPKKRNTSEDSTNTEDIAEDTSVDGYENERGLAMKTPKTLPKRKSIKRNKNNEAKKRVDEWDTGDVAEDSSAGDYDEDIDPLSMLRKSKTLPKKNNINKKLHEGNEATDRIDEVYDCFKELTQKSEPDTSSLYCNLLCNKLRSLSEGTRDIAMMKIDKLIYNLKQHDNQTNNGPNCYALLCAKTESLP